MPISLFDALTRRTTALTRRTALGGALATIIGGALALESEAKRNNQRRKRRKRKNRNRNDAVANAFGCLNVGDRCDGTDLQCCSGVCQPAPGGGKGKNRQAFCVAHDEGGCRPDQDICADDNEIDNRCGAAGICFRTTGQASFCGKEEDGDCFVCRTDADCVPTFGAGAACVVCADCEEDSASTGCVPPATGQSPS